MEKIGITGPQAFEKLVGRLRSTDKLPVPKSKKYWVFYQSKTIFSVIAAGPKRCDQGSPRMDQRNSVEQ